eukprot:4888168-Ditylum_brightwellii.AAC.2
MITTYPRMAMASVVATTGVVLATVPMCCLFLLARLFFGPDNHILSMSQDAQKLYPGGVLPPNTDRDQESHMPQALGTWPEMRWICMQTLVVK